MGVFVALDVSQEQNAICVVAYDGAILAEGKVVTCPDAIASWLSSWKEDIERIGMETGPLAVWLWNALRARNLPVICLDARHANGVLKMMPTRPTGTMPGVSWRFRRKSDGVPEVMSDGIPR